MFQDDTLYKLNHLFTYSFRAIFSKAKGAELNLEPADCESPQIAERTPKYEYL